MMIYLAGIIHNTDSKEIDNLKSHLFNLGCTVVSPDEKSLNKFCWSENLRWRLGLIRNSNAIYMLPNWKESIMARIELTAAMSEKLPFCFSLEEMRNLITTLDR